MSTTVALIVSASRPDVLAVLAADETATIDEHGVTQWGPDGAPRRITPRTVYPDPELVEVTVAEVVPADRLSWVDGALVIAASPKLPVPDRVSPLAARLALRRAGLLGAVEAALAQPTTPEEYRIAWEYATELHRTDAMVHAVGTLIGLSEEAVDDLFRAAASGP
ncbi:MAG: hypothetical protein EAZ99_16615 [Alphaproteobacteria bacterium]|nr:MAG: hypothetical protein EAZ99_16615 [Alphaproteobacteria bacterium]